MSDAKKRWSKPQLVVVSRGTPNEAVLVSGCKLSGMSGAVTDNTGCRSNTSCNLGSCYERFDVT